jgi:transcriptional regulator with XRE-family HTH domain
MVIGQRLRDSRVRQRLTLDDLAGRTGLSKAALSKIENGLVSSPISTYYRIAAVLGLDGGGLFGEPTKGPLCFVVRKDERKPASRQKTGHTYSFQALGYRRAHVPAAVGCPRGTGIASGRQRPAVCHAPPHHRRAGGVRDRDRRTADRFVDDRVIVALARHPGRPGLLDGLRPPGRDNVTVAMRPSWPSGAWAVVIHGGTLVIGRVDDDRNRRRLASHS